MKLDTASLKPRICAICKRDLAEIASPNDCEYCVLYQTVRFCPGKRLSKWALNFPTLCRKMKYCREGYRIYFSITKGYVQLSW